MGVVGKPTTGANELNISGGVLLVGGYSDDDQYLSTIYHLAHARATEWQLLTQELRVGRHLLTAFMVPDEVANCN